MGDPKRFAPIFHVRDLGGGYGFAVLDGAQLHIGVTTGKAMPASAYLFVDDADDLARRWASAGADVRGPEDTPWARREGAVTDPDGNIIRFGSPTGATAAVRG